MFWPETITETAATCTEKSKVAAFHHHSVEHESRINRCQRTVDVFFVLLEKTLKLTSYVEVACNLIQGE